MTYFLIGISMASASLFVVNLLASLAVSAAWGMLDGPTVNWSGKARANLIFLLRVLPLGLALTALVAFVMPSFIMFEPEHSGERLTFKMLVVVGIALFGMAAAGRRIVLSWLRTSRLLKEWSDNGERSMVKGVAFPLVAVRHPFPLIAVVGIFRPRIFIAEHLLESLNHDEIAAAVEHELGHVAERDNLKRVIVRLCGDLLIFPLCASFERLWSDAAERAADEYALRAGRRETALDLASALVKIGRLAPPNVVPQLPLAAYILSGADVSLAGRIERLVRYAGTVTSGQRSGGSRFLYGIPVALLLLLLPLALNERVLHAVHLLTENLIAVLQ